ncbi:hypothetical protein CHARACLAT_029719 [Characodon lateralis]|uniref:Uncharacterized protein n=1 Tax=Characodon lateralis TaxID=208331 RepID=A0ABU7EH60_9TELE|nr:hypothetical protein [Characodon lateralis]
MGSPCSYDAMFSRAGMCYPISQTVNPHPLAAYGSRQARLSCSVRNPEELSLTMVLQEKQDRSFRLRLLWVREEMQADCQAHCHGHQQHTPHIPTVSCPANWLAECTAS